MMLRLPERSAEVRHPLAALCAVGLGASLAAMDLAVNVAFPAITAAFALETAAIRWVVVCYVLIYASLMLACGSLGDHVGHRRVFRAGLLVSAAAFVACALAPSYPALLVARVAQGVGTALVLSCAPALALALFADSERTKALSAYSGLVALAGIAAPLAGGIAIAWLGWSGVFWFRAPLALLALLLSTSMPTRTEQAAPHAHGGFDPTGPALLAAALGALLLAPSLASGAATPWPAAASALAGACLLAAFARQQRRAAQPLVPVAQLRDPDFVLPNFASMAVHFVAFAVPLLLPYHLAHIGAHPPLAIGAIMLAWPCGTLLGSLLAAPAAQAIGARRTALSGAMLVAAGSCVIAYCASAGTLAPLLLALVLHGTGSGMFQVGYSDVIVASLPRETRGVAGSLTMVTRTVGVATAATALTAAMQALLERELIAGRTPAAAFASAFDALFLSLGIALAALVLASCWRRSAWFAR